MQICTATAPTGISQRFTVEAAGQGAASTLEAIPRFYRFEMTFVLLRGLPEQARGLFQLGRCCPQRFGQFASLLVGLVPLLGFHSLANSRQGLGRIASEDSGRVDLISIPIPARKA